MQSLPPHHFLDYYLGHSFGARFLMHSEEVHLDHSHFLPAYDECLGDSNDTSQYVSLLCRAHDELQLFDVARHLDAPAQLARRVFEPEITDIVFYVMVLKEFPQLLHLGVVFNIEIAPLITIWQFQWLCGYLVLVKDLYLTLFSHFLARCHDSLRVPKPVLPKYANKMLVLVPHLEVLPLVIDYALKLGYHCLLIEVRRLPIDPTLPTSFLNGIYRIKFGFALLRSLFLTLLLLLHFLRLFLLLGAVTALIILLILAIISIIIIIVPLIALILLLLLLLFLLWFSI